jgi:hypothetical protein
MTRVWKRPAVGEDRFVGVILVQSSWRGALMRVEQYLFDQLPLHLKQELQRRVDREFGAIPIVQEHVWAVPNRAVLGLVDGEVVSFLNIVDRQALADGNPLHLFGLNNVITEPQHRCRGYSRELNQKFLEFIREEDRDAIGLLFCADHSIPFYDSLGWKKFDGKVVISQPTGEKEWLSNAMLYKHNKKIDTSCWREINLCGLPW